MNATNRLQEYLPESELTDGEIEAGVADSTLHTWRIDATGEQWYRRSHGMIRAIPPGEHSGASLEMYDVKMVEADDDGFFEDDDDDDDD